jgi:hypothetical protein
MHLEDDFVRGLSPLWAITTAGNAHVRAEDGVLSFTDEPTPGNRYTNAQISDYDYTDFEMRWTPPLRLSVTARAMIPSGGLMGTAGFGFWNHPLSPSQKRRRPQLPRALWFFFAAPPSNMQLAAGVAGSGWKAATIDATTPRALALAPLALPVILLTRVPALNRALWPPVQRGLRISERLLDMSLLAERHTYAIEWRENGATFFVDDQIVHEAPAAPRGKMGFVAWIDNQYAIVTPQGKLGWGVVPLPEAQSLILEDVKIDK